jgi:DNA mismatch repair protein MutS
VPALAALLAGAALPVAGDVPELLIFDHALLTALAGVHARLGQALVDEPGALVKDGGFIRDGFCPEVDEQRRLATGGKDAILAIENRERERTGIPSLKVKYNRVFGYYIEVTRSQLSRVPDDYVRKQTIATGERYVTTELAELEARVLGAQELLASREQELFQKLCAEVAGSAEELGAAGQIVATVDCCAALAEVAHRKGYVRPEIDDSEVLDIVEGRHPVVEQVVPEGSFVPNDCHLDAGAEQILLITGPNMAGKSTYMRQVAHIVLLAQMGSFVPASRAVIGLVDRIFTRVGAADNLARGESTFMVEMRETAAILKGATRRSLVVLDEVGRGTSTFDGVSIAWAVTEYLHDAIGARTLFATHYHELCMLADSRPRVRNVSAAVREHGGEIVFLRQVVPGGASRSYGLDVARLAGLPRSVIARGKQILEQLEGGAQLGQGSQLSLFAAVQSAPSPDEDAAGEILARLRAMDPHRITPLDALRIVAELCAQAAE